MLSQLLEGGCAAGLATRIKANPELLTQFRPCAYLAAAIVEWNVPMVRLLSGLCVLRNNKRCRCWPNCFLEPLRLVRGGRSLLDMAIARAAASSDRSAAPAAVVMILMYRAGLPVATEMPSIVNSQIQALNSSRTANARNALFLLWALRQGCNRWLDKNVARLIVKQVFVSGLASLTAA